MTNKHILISGLNPAWQKTLFFHSFRPGEINRAESVLRIASGKGINCARAARTWAIAEPCVLQFLGGETGKRIREELDREGIQHLTVDTGAETRTCTTLVSLDGVCEMTELIEPAPAVSAASAAELMQHLQSSLPSSDALAICGTFPAGLPDSFYAEMAAEARKRGKFILLDSFLHVEKVLSEGVDLLKINKEELFSISGEKTMQKAVYSLMERFRPSFLAVTDGPGSACFSDGKELWRIEVPPVEKVLNPIGSGDTCSAVTLSEILAGTDPCEAFRIGLAAASANCLTELPACFSKDTALAMTGKSRICQDFRA